MKPPAFPTLCVHAGAAPDPATGARVQPIYHTNGFVFDDLDHGNDLFALDRVGYAYSRSGNPTVAAFERRIAALEGGTSAIACASGQSALLMLMTALCRTGDAVAAARQCFGGTIGLLKRFESQFGIAVQWFDAHDPDALERVITPATRAILVESLVNPTGDPVDLPTLATIADSHRLPLVVDATCATPALQKPFDLGAAIVWHSASKFFAGHGQAIGGVIVDSGRSDWIDGRYPLIVRPFSDYDDIDVMQKYPGWPFAAACRLVGMRELGPSLSPTNAFMLLTGVETLALRMERHCENALALHRFLVDHAAVAASSHPGLPGHPRHNLGKALFPAGIGSVQTVTLKGGRAAARHVTQRLKLFSQLVNVGEARSLVAHPTTTTHRNVGDATRALMGIEEGTLRISTGLEDIADLIADFEQALAGCPV
ncbi:MAG: O-acetylhomoserine aminocarboxypropyltransferase/cysteine synthase family protein [Beijerinckiaceae bacterium]